MQLVINTYGSYLRKKDNCFLVKNDNNVFEVSANKVDSILITTSAYLSTDAIEFAVENNVDIVFLNHFGDPYGRVWHSKLGSTTLIRRRQLEIYDKPEGLNLAKNWVSKKIRNQIKLLKKLESTRSEGLEKFREYADKIEKLKDKLNDLNGTLDEKRMDIMGLEGMASKTYFEAISSLMPERYKFNGRSRNPAIDEFNCLLNYSYGVLYSRVEKACIIAGLDPYIGFIHTDNYNKKSLVFDLIEMFRIYADKTVIYLFSKRKVNEKHFDKVPGGLSLNKEGKVLLIEELNKTFEKNIKYRGREVKVKNIIPLECHRIANELIKK